MCIDITIRICVPIFYTHGNFNTYGNILREECFSTLSNMITVCSFSFREYLGNFSSFQTIQNVKDFAILHFVALVSSKYLLFLAILSVIFSLRYTIYHSPFWKELGHNRGNFSCETDDILPVASKSKTTHRELHNERQLPRHKRNKWDEIGNSWGIGAKSIFDRRKSSTKPGLFPEFSWRFPRLGRFSPWGLFVLGIWLFTEALGRFLLILGREFWAYGKLHLVKQLMKALFQLSVAGGGTAVASHDDDVIACFQLVFPQTINRRDSPSDFVASHRISQLCGDSDAQEVLVLRLIRSIFLTIHSKKGGYIGRTLTVKCFEQVIFFDRLGLFHKIPLFFCYRLSPQVKGVRFPEPR